MTLSSHSLSDAARARGPAILAAALRAAAVRRRARNARRAGIVLAGAAAVIVAVVLRPLAPAPGAPQGEARSPAAVPAAPDPVSEGSRLTRLTAADDRATVVERIRTDPGLLARSLVAPVARVRFIGDAELLGALAGAGHPTGLLRAEGYAVLVPRETLPR